MADQNLNRYAPGGDLYASIQASYGTSAAEKVYAASTSGTPGAIAEALGEIRNGAPLDPSTADAFWSQITTDPLGAPVESLNNQVSKVFGDLFKNPFALLVVLGLAFLAFAYFGGFRLFRK